MKGYVLLLGLAAVFVLMVASKGRHKELRDKLPERLPAHLRESAEDAISDLEGRIADLRERARRVSGDAQRRIQEQIHELEERERDLRRRLDDLSAEAKRLLDRSRSQG